MEEIVYNVNFDFEAKLAGGKRTVKGASWFDHIFFFINQNPNAKLNSKYKFSKDYLKYLKSLNVKSVQLSSESQTVEWWSHDSDLQRNKFFNSKIEMTRLGLEKNWIPINTQVGLEKIDSFQGRVVARSDWGFSGRGTHFFNSGDDTSNLKGEFVLSEFVKKIKDYGITFDLSRDDFFIIENYIDERGQFKGGELVSDEDIGLDNLNTLFEIKDELVSLGARGFIQIDCFSYENGFHPFVEVNYRRTMGQMIYHLSLMTGKKFTSWRIFKNNGKDLNLLNLSESFITSPVDKFISICTSSDNEDNFEKEKIELEKFFS